MEKLKIIYLHKDKLQKLEGNPRKLKDPEAIKKLTKLIKEHGFQNPLNVYLEKNKSYSIIAGNHRFEAGCGLGMEEFPCIVYEGDRNKALARCISDNKSSDWTEWDFPKLKDFVVELDSGDFDLELTGFDVDELSEVCGYEGGATDDDAIPDVPEIPKTKKGDLYLLGKHRLLCGDSTDIKDVERLMDGKKADMVFTDPPYAVNYGADQDVLNKKSGGKFRLTARPIINDNLTAEQCAELLWKPAFKNYYEVANDDCSFYMTMCQGGDQMMMMMMMMSEHWQVKHELIWVKSSPVFSMGRLDYDYQHEPILYGWKKKHNWYGKGQFLKSIWEIPKPNKSDLHTTMKPLALMENALMNSSLENNICIDFFLGSGSTLIACEKTNRICYGMEIDPHYTSVILDRWANYTGKDPIREDGKSWQKIKEDGV